MRATWTAALLGLSLACGGGPAPRTVDDDEARRYVAAACGVRPSSSDCAVCALETLDALRRQRVITSAQHDVLKRDAAAACGAPACVPTTTCAASGRGCGQVSDGCGGTLTCRAPCDSRAWCVLRNAIRAPQPLGDYSDTQVGDGFAAIAVSDDGIPACADPGPALEAAIALVRERCGAAGGDLLELYCGANSDPAVSADALLHWVGDPCWARVTKIELAQGSQACVSP
jgi:hypothetical protein